MRSTLKPRLPVIGASGRSAAVDSRSISVSLGAR